MAASGSKHGANLGFLTIVEDAQHGVFGGFLVLNAAGRPLEFHCTTPVKPNRAQEILYGPTLRPYLYGEQIAPALVAKAAATLDLLCVDLPEALSVRLHVKVATVLVAPIAETEEAISPATLRIDPAHSANGPSPGLHWFAACCFRLAVHGEFIEDRNLVVGRLESLANFDLCEPFGRIREAIQEAQRGGR
jgi:hypothetical protein